MMVVDLKSTMTIVWITVTWSRSMKSDQTNLWWNNDYMHRFNKAVVIRNASIVFCLIDCVLTYRVCLMMIMIFHINTSTMLRNIRRETCANGKRRMGVYFAALAESWKHATILQCWDSNYVSVASSVAWNWCAVGSRNQFCAAGHMAIHLWKHSHYWHSLISVRRKFAIRWCHSWSICSQPWLLVSQASFIFIYDVIMMWFKLVVHCTCNNFKSGLLAAIQLDHM